MSQVVYRYKCRRCGDVSIGSGSPESMMPDVMAKAILGTGQIGLISIHSCGDNGAMGITDLIGAEKRE